MTLEGLPPSGANSKLYHYKKEVREMTDIPETRFLRENKLKVSEEEKRTQTNFSAVQKTHCNTRTQMASIEQGLRKQ